MLRNNNKTKRRGPVKGRRNGANRGDQIIPHPPQLPSYGITRDARMRFQTNAAVSVAVTFQNLLDTVLTAASATSGFDLYDGVRINSIEVWAASVTGAPVTAIVVYSGETIGAQGDQKTHTDTSMGIEPAHVKARPDRMTQAGQFQASSADTAFALNLPSGAVIDVSCSFRQSVSGQAVATQNVLVGATPGAIYYRGLDGKTDSLTSIPVQGVFATQ